MPATALGKVLASIIALTGVAFIALPAGIQGAGFIEEFEKVRNPISALTKRSPERIGVADEILKFAQLRDDAIISDAEFANQKAWLLKRN